MVGLDKARDPRCWGITMRNDEFRQWLSGVGDAQLSEGLFLLLRHLSVGRVPGLRRQ